MEKALNGDFQYYKEIMDRVEGKAIAQLDVTTGGEQINKTDLSTLKPETQAAVLDELGGPTE